LENSYVYSLRCREKEGEKEGEFLESTFAAPKERGKLEYFDIPHEFPLPGYMSFRGEFDDHKKKYERERE